MDADKEGCPGTYPDFADSSVQMTQVALRASAMGCCAGRGKMLRRLALLSSVQTRRLPGELQNRSDQGCGGSTQSLSCCHMARNPFR